MDRKTLVLTKDVVLSLTLLYGYILEKKTQVDLEQV